MLFLVIFEGNKNGIFLSEKTITFKSYIIPWRTKIGTNDVALQYKLRYFQTSEKPKQAILINVILSWCIFSLNTGNIARETCKSYKQTPAFSLVCLLDLQLSREMFPYFNLRWINLYEAKFFSIFRAITVIILGEHIKNYHVKQYL